MIKTPAAVVVEVLRASGGEYLRSDYMTEAIEARDTEVRKAALEEAAVLAAQSDSALIAYRIRALATPPAAPEGGNE